MANGDTPDAAVDNVHDFDLVSDPLPDLVSISGCQMVYYQTKNPNSGKFRIVLQWKILVYFIDTWSILQSFVIFYGHFV
jgi:hypothetical protein